MFKWMVVWRFGEILQFNKKDADEMARYIRRRGLSARVVKLKRAR
jgi:hypothetical protein